MTQQPSIQLIGIGHVPAVALSEVKPGDTLMWNYGCTSKVVAVTPITAKTIELVTEESSPTSLWTQRKRATTLVARVRDIGGIWEATG